MDNDEKIKQNNNSNDNSVAIVSMILGIIGVITCWVPILGFVLAIIALILSIKGFSNFLKKLHAPLAQLDRALVYGTKG